MSATDSSHQSVRTTHNAPLVSSVQCSEGFRSITDNTVKPNEPSVRNQNQVTDVIDHLVQTYRSRTPSGPTRGTDPQLTTLIFQQGEELRSGSGSGSRSGSGIVEAEVGQAEEAEEADRKEGLQREKRDDAGQGQDRKHEEMSHHDEGVS